MTGPLRRIPRIALLLATLAAPALLAIPAAAQAVEPADFGQRKALHIHAQQQEIVIRTETLACVGLATDDAAIKVCLEKMHQQLDALRAQQHR